MASKWEQQDLGHKVREVLRCVPTRDGKHHFGRAFITAYQLAIEIERRNPGSSVAVGM